MVFDGRWLLGELHDRLTARRPADVVGVGCPRKIARTVFSSPSGVDADLVRNGDGTYSLTEHSNSDVLKFSSGGASLRHADRNGNAITYDLGSGATNTAATIVDTKEVYDITHIRARQLDLQLHRSRRSIRQLPIRGNEHHGHLGPELLRDRCGWSNYYDYDAAHQSDPDHHARWPRCSLATTRANG